MKIKIDLEFPINSSPQLLYQYLSTPSGLSEWFADEVTMNETESVYTFRWGKSSISQAEIVHIKPQISIRYRWLDHDESVYFEFRLRKLELTGEMTLEVTDFAEPDEKGDAITLWESQVEEMKRRLGV